MKPSAYRSMRYGKPSSPEETKNLIRWVDEKWRNLTPLTLGDTKFYQCGKKSKEQIQRNLPSVCRPSVKISNATPALANNYNKQEIKKAVNIKKQGKTIIWGKL